jgi:hypothetical protein
MMINEDLRGPRQLSSVHRLLFNFRRSQGKTLSLRPPMSEKLIRTIEEGALCFAGRARFVLTG